jgi:hypothetical protein
MFMQQSILYRYIETLVICIICQLQTELFYFGSVLKDILNKKGI